MLQILRCSISIQLGKFQLAFANRTSAALSVESRNFRLAAFAGAVIFSDS